MPASTIVPIATAIPPSDIMFRLRPCRCMTMKAIRMPTGSVMMATSPLRKWTRKRMQTSATITNCWINASCKLSTERSISVERSYATSITTPSGRPPRTSSRRALTSLMTCSVSAPERTTMMPPTVSPSPFQSARPRRISGPMSTRATSRSNIGVPRPSTPSAVFRMSSTDSM